VKIHRLTTGRVRGPRRPHGIRRYVRLEWSGETLPVNAFLIEHRAGLCLVDTGQSAEAAVPGYLPRWHPFLRTARFELAAGDEAVAQVRRLGFRPEQVRWIVLTHLHTDHVGGLAAFPSSEVVVSETEWRRAGGFRGQLIGYVPKQLPAGLAPRLVRLTEPGVGPFATSLALDDERSLNLVPLPGHTPGQIGLLAVGERRSALLGGDVAHNWRELQEAAPELAAYCSREHVSFLAAHEDDLPEVLDLSEGG